MTTDVVKGTQRHITVAHDDDRILVDLDREELPRLRDLRLDTDEDPVAPENPRDIRIEDFTAQVERRGQRVAGLALCDQILKGVGVHLRDSLSTRAQLPRGSARHSR